MTAALWEPILAGALLFAVVLMAAFTVTALLLVRYGRRKWRAFHAHGMVVGARSLWEATSSGQFRRGPVPPTGDMSGWSARLVRRELWRAVDQADAAVRAASRAGAPTASLPTLCRRLQSVTADLDQVLRVEGTGPVPADVAAQASEVMKAAADVHRAATASASDATGQQVQHLVRDADHEIECLDAGLASARSVIPRPTA